MAMPQEATLQSNGLVADLCKIIERQSHEIHNLRQQGGMLQNVPTQIAQSPLGDLVPDSLGGSCPNRVPMLTVTMQSEPAPAPAAAPAPTPAAAPPLAHEAQEFGHRGDGEWRRAGPPGPLGTTRDHSGPLGTTRDHTGPHGTAWVQLCPSG